MKLKTSQIKKLTSNLFNSIEQRRHVIYCDDSIYDWLKKRGYNPIPESRMPSKFRQLMPLADNLAN